MTCEQHHFVGDSMIAVVIDPQVDDSNPQRTEVIKIWRCVHCDFARRRGTLGAAPTTQPNTTTQGDSNDGE